MNLEKIELKKKFKNYKILCESLGEESAKGGRNRRLQQENFRRFFDWTVEGREITITKIYEVVKEKIDGRKGNSGGANNQVYMQHIDPILTDFFSRLEKRDMYITMNQLAERVGILNKNYREVVSSKSAFFKFLKEEDNIYNYTAMDNVFYSVHDRIKTVRSSMERLQKEGVIDYEYNFTLHRIEGGVEIQRMATVEETKQIKKCEEFILADMDIEKYEIMKNETTMKEYYEKLDELVYKTIEGVFMCYKGFRVVVTDETRVKFNPEDIQNHKIALNEVVKERVYNRNVKHLEELQARIDKVAYGKYSFMKHESEMISEDYLTSTETIMEYLIGLNPKKVKLTKTITPSKTIKKVVIDNSPTKEVKVIELLNGQEIHLETIAVEPKQEEIEVKEIEPTIEWGFDVSYMYDRASGKLKDEYKPKPWKFVPKYDWQKEDFIGSEYSNDELISYSEETGRYIFL